MLCRATQDGWVRVNNSEKTVAHWRRKWQPTPVFLPGECHVCLPGCFSWIWLFVTTWTVVHQAPLFMGFSRQEYWSGLPCPPLGDFPNPWIESVSPVAPDWRRMLYSWAIMVAPKNPIDSMKRQNDMTVEDETSSGQKLSRRCYWGRVEGNYYNLGDISDKEPTCQCGRHKRLRFSPWVWKIPWRRTWQPTLVFLPGNSHWQRNLVSYSP